MTDKKDETAARIAQLEAEIAALKAKVDPPKSTFTPMSDAEWIDKMRALSERRMDYATPPEVVRDMSVLDDRLVKEVALRDARAPTSPSSAIPSSQPAGGGGPLPSSTPGWSEPRPLTNPPGINWVDAQLIADDVRQRKAKP
jgi:hypothetical protein